MKQSERRPDQKPIFVISKSGRPLAPTRRPGRVRYLLKSGCARIVCYDPFAVQLLYDCPEFVQCEVTVAIKEDSKDTTIVAAEHITRSDTCSIVYAKEILQRAGVSAHVKRRTDARRSRRNRKTRYRKKRFDNRPKSLCSICGRNHTPKTWAKVERKTGTSLKKVGVGRSAVCRKCEHQGLGEHFGRLAEKHLTPALRNRVDATVREVGKLTAIMPVTKIMMEPTAPYAQIMAYLNGQLNKPASSTMSGHTVIVREYLLGKHGHQCVYCKGQSGDRSLVKEHVIPKSRGGSDALYNLVISCKTCNDAKGAKTAAEFGYPEINEMAAKFLRVGWGAIIQRYQRMLWQEFEKSGTAVEVPFGSCTKHNRLRTPLPKVIYTMVVAANGLKFAPPKEYMVEKRLKIRSPFHRFTNENRKGWPCRKTLSMREVGGFQLHDEVSFIDGNGSKTCCYITALRKDGSAEVSDLEGNLISKKSLRKLTLEHNVYRKRFIERRRFEGNN